MNRRDFARLGLSVSTLTALSKTASAQAIGTGPGKLHAEGADIRRVGIRVNGAHWTAGKESIDTLSGNLNIALPVLTAKSRGLSVPLQLSYNSQNWEKTSSGSVTRNGTDLGVGFGWRLQFGCIVPATGGGTGYTYIDGTGAEYVLYSVSDGWASQQGIRATFVPGTSQLCFWNGVVWTFGCTSANGEADAGALYPTLIEDTNGNQILITYAAGKGASSVDSSSRISAIQDARAQAVSSGRATYQFVYDSDSTPHLTSISSLIGTGEAPQFSYSGLQVSDPWTSSSYGAPQISEVAMPSGLNTYFSYNTDGTIKTAQFPHGASVNYTYTNFTFSDGRSVSEVTSRSVSPGNGDSGFQVSFTRPSGDSGLLCHSQFTATESPASSSSGIRVWTFSTNQNWEAGLALSYTEANSSGTVRRQTNYIWVQNTDGTPYISSTSVTLDPGTSSAATTKVQVSKDAYGNPTQLTHYDYNSTTPLRTVNNSYLNSSTYTGKFIRNRLASSSVTANGQTTQLASHVYDSTSLTARSGLQEHDDTNFGASNTVRGNATESTVGGVYVKRTFDVTGLPVSTQDSTGSSVAFTPASNTNNGAIGAITPNGDGNLSKQVTYDTALRPLVTTAPNAATVTRTYDSAGRVASITSADGSQTTYAYGANPTTITATKNGRWSKVIHDNFGRPTAVQRGSGSTTASQVNYLYGQSPNSPNGKLLTRTLPFVPGAKTVNLNYSYDEIGRITSATHPASGGTITYSRSGNSTTVTDPAGRWKTLAHSADGTLASVQTPGAGSTPTFQTSYGYNGIRKLTTVNMPRPEGTQQRTFSYDSGGRALTLNHVETGPKNYTYNNDGTVATFKDNIGQSAAWSYDPNKRVTALKRYYANGTQDPVTSRQFYYDTNPFDSSYSQNAQGRLTAVQWGSTSILPGQFTQMYSYNSAGRMIGKRLMLERGSSSVEIDLIYTYDNEGRISTIGYPGGGTLLTYSYDSLGRVSGITQNGTPVVQNVSYNPADRLLTLEHQVGTTDTYVSETRGYTPWNQVASLNVGPNAGANNPALVTNMDLQYSYAPDAKLASESNQTDGTGASYTYDSKGRLATAASSGSQWGISESFDGFGNRTAQTLTKGSAPVFSGAYSAANNQMVGASYDANGNVTSASGTQIRYLVNNMPSQVITGAGTENYAYDPENRRVWKQYANGTEELYIYGFDGRRLATYTLTYANNVLTATSLDVHIHFGSRMIRSRSESVVVTRLNHVRAWSNAQSGARGTQYLPYGEELTTTEQDREKFGSYVRDSGSGLDYAHNRYYSNNLGRFVTPDPYERSARLDEPESWNKYSFACNDPVNRVDPNGLDDNGQWDSGGYDGWGDNSNAAGGGPSYYSQPAANGGTNYYYSDGVNFNVSSAFGAQPLEDSFADLPTTPPPYTGPASDGTISDDAAQIFGQVGQNVAGFNTALGIFAGGSLLLGGALGVSGLTSAGTFVSTAPIQEGTQVYRVYSGVNGSYLYSSWWSPINPATTPDYLEGVGAWNTGGNLATATINSETGYAFGFSAPNEFGVGGGLPEVYIHNPSSVLTNVTTVPFP